MCLVASPRQEHTEWVILHKRSTARVFMHDLFKIVVTYKAAALDARVGVATFDNAAVRNFGILLASTKRCYE